MRIVVIALVLVAAACSSGPDIVSSSPLDGPEAYSLDGGAALERPDLYPDRREEFEWRFEEAQAFYEANPDSEAALVWLGRYLAYLGRYRESVGIYTRGISLYPNSYKLHRHRGHRYITLRQLDLAERDLVQASFLMAGIDDQVEPDGIPNERNEPRSTYHGNVWYHLGLAYYLQGRFEKALPCYLNCRETCTNDDMLCAASHWLYMTLRRLGRDEEAAAVLEPIHAEMDVIENEQYHKLLLMYRGELDAAALEAEVAGDDIASATLAYGLANWHLYNDRTERAFALFERIVQGEAWPAFGHIAAEAELARRE